MSLCRKILAAGLAALATATMLLAAPAHAATTQPLHIVTIGDSYASGEGDKGSGWIDPACERSAGAAPQRAAAQLNSIWPVNFTSFACLGSVIDPAEGNPPTQTLLGSNGQLSQVDPARNTPVDALTISIGGNDIGFAKIVTACSLSTKPCSADPNVTGPLSRALSNLPGYLGNLITAINAKRPDIRNVFLTAYPDPTTGPGLPGNPSGLCGIWGPDPGFEGFGLISQTDSAWASSSVVAPLNAALQAAVNTASSQSGSHAVWHFVSTISSAFSGHGFCTGGGSPDPLTWFTPRYVSTPADSQTSQGDINGSMHPNDLGQRVIANIIYGSYLSLLSTTTLADVATALCLDSNDTGAVYTLRCNGGNYQQWLLKPVAGYTSEYNIIDGQTARCLDSNGSGQVYTSPCNGGNYQNWNMTPASSTPDQFQDIATQFCLDSNTSGQAYTLSCNGGNYQHWQRSS
jgi:lysophospholipase L1-like esterase